MAQVVERLISTLGIETDQASVNKAKNALDSVKNAALGLATSLGAAFSGKALFDFAAGVADVGDSIAKTANNFGFLTDSLQEIRFAGERSGVTLNETDKALRQLTRGISETAAGFGVSKRAFDALGVAVTDGNGRLRDTEAVLFDLANALENTQSEADRFRFGADLFGARGAKFLNALEGGGEGLNNLRQVARDLGGVLDKDLLKSSEQFQDTFLDMGRVMRGLKNIGGRELIPFFNDVAGEIIQWVKENRELIQQNLGGFFRNLVSRLKDYLQIAKNVVTFMVTLANSFTTFQQKIIIATAAIGALAAALASPLVAIGLIGAALLLGIDDFETWRKGGESEIGKLLGEFSNFETTIKDIGKGFNTLLVDPILTGISTVFLALTSLGRGLGAIFSGDFSGAQQIGLEFLTTLETEGGRLADNFKDFFADPVTQVSLVEPVAAAFEAVPTLDSITAGITSSEVKTQTNTVNVGAPVINVQAPANASPESVANLTQSGLGSTVQKLITDAMSSFVPVE